MYLAEIHGKLSAENENKEDILTSNVFSFFSDFFQKVQDMRSSRTAKIEICFI
jgi:hypothetical protein